MALINRDKVKNLQEHIKIRDSGLTYMTEDGKEKAIMVMAQQGQPAGGRKSPNATKGRHRWHTDEKKIEVCTLYAAVGNAKKVAELTKVPEGTVTRWMTEDWWALTSQRIKREEGLVTDKKFSTIVDKALVKLEERIEKGDMMYDIKRGKVVPVEVSARDLAIVTGTIFDKRQLLRGEATKITSVSTSEEHLKQLATQFTTWVKEKQEKAITLKKDDYDIIETVVQVKE